MSLSRLLNTAWMLSCRRAHTAFLKATRQVQLTQTSLLRQILNRNRDCRFGRRHDFASIQDIDQFRGSVPLAGYSEFEPDIEDICAGKSGILTSEAVRLLEPTSGTTSGRRLIPYTTSLQQQFQRGINVWIADLFSHRPAVRQGRAYWSVTPAIENETTPGGLRIGFAEDTEYLHPIAQNVARRLLAITAKQMLKVDQKQVFYETLRRLIHVRDLSLISVWSPTFLTTMAHRLEVDSERIHHTLRKLDDSRNLLEIVRSNRPLPDKLRAIWPQLAVISCWADGSAAYHIPQLQALFPEIEIQPKGLVSTEAFVSIPLVNCQGSALAIQSHFFEFQPVDGADSSVRLAHELIEGHQYKVIVTTGGGLYRYQTQDVVSIVGSINETPLIQFCGRGDQTIDLVGEKLAEFFVEDAVRNALTESRLRNPRVLLVPDAKRPGYRLFVSCSQLMVPALEIRDAVETRLSDNPYYKHAVQVGQLSPLSITIVEHPGELVQAYEDQLALSGVRRGDIKPTILVPRQYADRVLKRLLPSGADN